MRTENMTKTSWTERKTHIKVLREVNEGIKLTT